MSRLRNLLVLGAALGLSLAAYAGDEQKTAAAAAPTSTTATTTEKVQPHDKININTASADELRKVKGIGPKISQAIIEHRSKNGNFKSINDLLNVKSRGIHQHWFDKVSSRLTV